MTPLVSTIAESLSPAASMLAALDALSDLNVASCAQFHDYDGALLATLRTWAASRNIEVRRVVLDLPDRVWDSFAVMAGRCSVTVHDERSRRKPVEASAVREALKWRPTDGEVQP